MLRILKSLVLKNFPCFLYFKVQKSMTRKLSTSNDIFYEIKEINF